MEGGTNFSRRLQAVRNVIFECLEIIDVGCNLKQFDGLTWLTLTFPLDFTTDLRHWPSEQCQSTEWVNKSNQYKIRTICQPKWPFMYLLSAYVSHTISLLWAILCDAHVTQRTAQIYRPLTGSNDAHAYMYSLLCKNWTIAVLCFVAQNLQSTRVRIICYNELYPTTESEGVVSRFELGIGAAGQKTRMIGYSAVYTCLQNN